jgi:transcriptional regulator with XRE-family HTH domain
MIGAQIRAARALLGWDQRTLAGKAGVRAATLSHLENADGEIPCRYATMRKLVRAFESAGVEFIGERGVQFTAVRAAAAPQE